MNLLIIAYYELKRIFRNHRLVILVLSQPIVIAIIVGLIVFHDPKDIKLGIVIKNNNQASQELGEEIKNNNNFIASYFSRVDDNEIKNGNLRGFVVIDLKNTIPPAGTVEILNDPMGRSVKYIVESEINKSVMELGQNISLNSASLKLEEKDLTPFSLKNFDYFASAMMVLMIILATINLSGISITTERATGTFERLFVTPYSKIDVIFGKALALFFVGTIVAIIGTLSLYLFFSVSIGNLALVALINLLVVATSVTLGLLVSSITYSVVESVELSMYIFFVSVLTTTIFTPIETANQYMAKVIKFIPFYYAVDASRKVNMTNAHWVNISTNIYILIGTFLFFLILSIILLRREAK